MPTPTTDTYDLILVGTGFASSFFLHKYLERSPESRRVLVLERGELHEHSWQLDNPTELMKRANESFVNRNPKEKWWLFSLGFGGGSNCWWACTPRMLPADFRLRSLYGVGRDWPVSYDELEEDYTEAEELMAISGPDDGSPFPRSRPYPQPPHHFSDPDRLFKKAFPDRYFQQPCARPTRATDNGRPRCCASGVCHLCPINSKFTILNSMRHLYRDPRVTLTLGANVVAVEAGGGRVTGVRYLAEGVEHTARGELVALGANALFNPFILQRSGIDHPLLGRNLSEQVAKSVRVKLDGVDNFQGSTSITGHGYMLYDGPHRKSRAAALMESWNVPHLRMERGKWRRHISLKFIFEDLPREENLVRPSERDPSRPEAVFTGHSEYALRGLAALPGLLDEILAPLPVENVSVPEGHGRTEAHILGTAVMGNDPPTSVVDRHLIHHRLRNLLVLGGSAFPTAAPANPTLTIAALSLWAARHLTG